MYRVIVSSPNGSLPSESEDDDDFTTPIRANLTSQLTTVDLNLTVGTSAATTENNLTSGISSPSHHSSEA